MLSHRSGIFTGLVLGGEAVGGGRMGGRGGSGAEREGVDE